MPRVLKPDGTAPCPVVWGAFRADLFLLLHVEDATWPNALMTPSRGFMLASSAETLVLADLEFLRGCNVPAGRVSAGGDIARVKRHSAARLDLAQSDKESMK